MNAQVADVAPPLPRALQVEVTGACNLRCRMCLVRYRPALGRVAGSLPMADFRAILEALPDVDTLVMQGLGEPLLAPDFFAMMALASSRGIQCGFNTNATLLTPGRAERLAALHPAWVHVSLDGATAPTYESIRDGASFTAVATNVAVLVDAVRRAGPPRPELSLVCVAMRRNVEELPQLVRLAHAWGVGDVWAQNLSHAWDDVHETPDFAAIREFTLAEALWLDDGAEPPTFAEARAEAARLGVRLRLPRVTPREARRARGTPGCDWPWRSAYVRHDGKVQPCCMLMGEDRAILGDLHEEAFADVWHGPRYTAFRAALCTDTPPAPCEGCASWRGVF